MTKILELKLPTRIAVRGKLGDMAKFGHARYGFIEFGEQDDEVGIYQMRKVKEGIRPVKMTFYQPTYKNTTPLMENRTAFANAISSWQALTAEQKKVYNGRVRRLRMSGYNLYIKEYLREIIESTAPAVYGSSILGKSFY